MRTATGLPILRCSGCGAPVRFLSKDELVEAILDPEWEMPSVQDSCLWCGPAGRARAKASA